MKKVIACVCAFLMLLTMVGCGQSSAASSMAASQGAESSESSGNSEGNNGEVIHLTMWGRRSVGSWLRQSMRKF